MNHDFKILRLAIQFVVQPCPEFQKQTGFEMAARDIVQLRRKFVVPLIREHFPFEKQQHFYCFFSLARCRVLLSELKQPAEPRVLFVQQFFQNFARAIQLAGTHQRFGKRFQENRIGLLRRKWFE